MKITDGRLCDDNGRAVPFRASPNIGGKLEPKLLIMHFTAGASAESSVDWLCDRKAKASAHVVIGRDGAVTQLVPFDRKAWHAGKSQWKGRSNCNDFAIGIELDNAGKLSSLRGKWTSEFGRAYPADDVLEATHKNETEPAGWEKYTPAQLETAEATAAAIVKAYGIPEIVGHEDVSPGRKNDPGPAFPMNRFSLEVMERAGGLPDTAVPAPPVPENKTPIDSAPEVRRAEALEYVTTDELNIRTGPGAKFGKTGPALPKGATVKAAPQNWWYVETRDGRKGWVHSGYLMPAAGAQPVPDKPAAASGEEVENASEGSGKADPRDPSTSLGMTEPRPALSADEAAVRLKIAGKIVDFEARRDARGKIKVYDLPSGDGGGSYEVAGINQRYHPVEAAELRDLIRAGKQDEAEARAREVIAEYTDVVATWTTCPPIEAYLRDCAFNRGPGGAARILQMALGVHVDGGVGKETLEALAIAERDPAKLLRGLRAAREQYELKVAGRREKFWKGLTNRWNNSLEFAQTFIAEPGQAIA